MTFLRPEAFFLLIPFTLPMVLFKKSKRKGGMWEKLCDAELLSHLLKNTSRFSSLPFLCLAGLGLLGIAALAGPTWKQEALPTFQGNGGLVIALDLSSSMLAEDVKPNRLKRALYKIEDILQKRQEGQTALLVYTDHPYVVTPLTNDTKTIQAQLPVLEPSLMPSQGLRHDLAIAKAGDLLKQGGVVEGSILLLTAEAGKGGAVSSTFPVSVLGIGSEQGAPIPKGKGGFVQDKNGELFLSRLAKRELTKLAVGTGGRFATITPDERDIQHLLALSQQTYGAQEAVSFQWLDQGYWFVLLLLPIAAFLIRRGELAFTLFFLSSISPVEAFSWKNFWKRSDQQGAEYFAEENYEEAATYFRDPEWKAAANYRLGNFDEALKGYEGITTADGYYNLGNAHAKMGAFQEAIDAYTQALEKDPDHEDAAYNKKLLEGQMQQQQNDEQEGKQNKEQQEGEQGEQEKDKQGQQQDQNEQEQEEQEPHPEQQDEEKSEEEEQEERDQQWLQRVPDDPGGLLRRKFLYQYQNQKGHS